MASPTIDESDCNQREAAPHQLHLITVGEARQAASKRRLPMQQHGQRCEGVVGAQGGDDGVVPDDSNADHLGQELGLGR